MVKEMVVRLDLARIPQTLKPYPLLTPVKSEGNENLRLVNMHDYLEVLLVTPSITA